MRSDVVERRGRAVSLPAERAECVANRCDDRLEPSHLGDPAGRRGDRVVQVVRDAVHVLAERARRRRRAGGPRLDLAHCGGERVRPIGRIAHIQAERAEPALRPGYQCTGELIERRWRLGACRDRVLTCSLRDCGELCRRDLDARLREPLLCAPRVLGLDDVVGRAGHHVRRLAE